MHIICLWILLLIALCGSTPVIAGEAIAVVVATNHPLEKISLNELKRIYLRKNLVNKKGVRWVPVNLNLKDPLRRDFSLTLFSSLPESQNDYWNNQYFHGINPPKVMASEEAVLRFVASTPGAIGYVRHSSVDSSVKILLLLHFPGKVD